MMDIDRNLVDSFYDAVNSLLELKNQPNLNNSESKLESFKILLSSPQWKNESGLKIMASQYIPTYIQYFTSLHEVGINAQLDLCEDDDGKVRREAIKNLPVFAKNAPKYASRLVDVLLQLLQSDDREELVTVSKALLVSFQSFPKDFTDAFFYQIERGTYLVRQQAFLFLDCHLLPLKAPAMKQKMLNRFLQLLETVSFSEQELDVVISLVSSFQMSGNISYNTQLDLLYKKKLEAMVAIPENTTFEKIAKVHKLYTPLFISGASSFRFICFLSSHVLNKSIVSLGIADKVSVLKMICDLLGYVSELWSLCDIIPIFERLLHELLPSISKTDTHFRLESLALEPLSFFLIFCRLKCPNVNRTNSSELAHTLGKALNISKHVKTLACSVLEGLENGLKKEKLERMSASIDCAILFFKELQKGPNSSSSVLLTTSWNLPLASKSVLVLDKDTEKKVAANLSGGKKKIGAIQKKEPGILKTTAEKIRLKKETQVEPIGRAQPPAPRTNDEALPKTKFKKKVGKKVAAKALPKASTTDSPSGQTVTSKSNVNPSAKLPIHSEIAHPAKNNPAAKHLKLSLSRAFTVQAAPFLKPAVTGSISAAAETQESKLNAKIFSVKPAVKLNASRPESPITLLSLEKRPIDTEAKREVKVVKKSFTLVKKQSA